LKKIAVVTSGGDAPGMNAAIRAITRLANLNKIEVTGFERGWEGILTNTHKPLTSRSVGGIIQQGGTMLRTARCTEFMQSSGVKQAAQILADHKTEALIVIGGDGSFKGAYDLSKQTDIKIIGIPATIDNDVFGTDETIGFDTAVNTAQTEIDKVRDTALSHERTFVVEVMGRKRGFLASAVGLAVGAEIILVPEVKHQDSRIYQKLKENTAKGKKSSIIVAAEGTGDTRTLAEQITKNTGMEARLTVLGYVQRGGSPTARSRILASLFAEKAIELLTQDKVNRIATFQRGRIGSIDLEKSCRTEKSLDTDLLELAEKLAT
jgi:6-phosphofructokinase 1